MENNFNKKISQEKKKGILLEIDKNNIIKFGKVLRKTVSIWAFLTCKKHTTGTPKAHNKYVKG